MKGTYRAALQRRAQTRETAAQVLNLITSALTEVSTEEYANFVQGTTIVTSLEDEVLRIDSEAEEIVEIPGLPSAGEASTTYSTGTLPTRATSGKLQRIRGLRAALMGTPTSPGGAILSLQQLLSTWE